MSALSGADASRARPSSALRHRRVFLPVIVALALSAWAALWAWGRSPYAGYLDHSDIVASGPAAFLCRMVPGGNVIVPATLYAAAWVLMTVAMMLPTTLPLFGIFDRLTALRRDHGRLMLLLGFGYLTIWGAFGLLAHLLHGLLLFLVGSWPGLAWNGWLIGAATIAMAGAFQFSGLKRRCLEKCRIPLSFVIEHWRGRSTSWHAYRLGAHHGLFCVGCCWALMLLMFVVGAGSLGWMLALAVVMAIEKNVPWGVHLGAPLGIALLSWATFLVATQP
ncbi:DUF2182 domain-containing protein [Methylovirgula sp. 4M-Z18]|uniref:DUF2182 domain-containing protein n=1 Tax=Methylovirgula sp. 4M-Z18 TaxID=2293567 RepID=UPI000E2EB6C3|nr:DUF2182 domain-containing protein [Methylovirgula sp. 4M-Z18]RFB81154.1 DUF2182 domain-containing protein [Methylovirgula sp. 4M-Z18]